MRQGPSFSCRPGCAACCIAPSISSPIPEGSTWEGLPKGKAPGVPCPALSPEGLCRLFARPDRPGVCASLKASPEMCGTSKEEALAYLARLEELTAP